MTLFNDEINQALKMFNNGLYAESENICNAILKNKPSHAAANHMLGVIAFRFNKMKMAIKLFKKSIKENKNNDECYLNLGHSYNELGDKINAIKNYRLSLSINNAGAVAHYSLANVYLEKNNLNQAEQHYISAIKYKPDFYSAYYNLGNLYKKTSDFKNAIINYKKSLSINSNLVEAENNLALVHEALGDTDESISCYLRAIDKNPDYLNSYINFGNLYASSGFSDKAIAIYNKSILINPDYALAYYSMACVYYENKKTDKALACFTKSIELNPENALAFKSVGNIYKALGQSAEAEINYRSAISIESGYAEAYRELTSVTTLHANSREMTAMKKILADKTRNSESRMHVAYGLGKSYENLTEYDSSFKYYVIANDLRKKYFSYNNEKELKMFSDIKSLFSRRFIEKFMQYGLSDKVSVFVLGMPRSGTSLVEQILASHTQVTGAGELPYLSELSRSGVINPHNSDFPSCIKDITPEVIGEVAAQYLSLIGDHMNGEKYLIDKMPHNFLLIGLIKIILPNAKIIHIKRNAMDNCLSIFKKGFKSGHSYADDLHDLGCYYNMYAALMQHWNQVMPNVIYEVNYEELVNNQQQETQRLLAYCELPWQDACLSFYETRREVNTASATQVRRGIYTDSVNAWKHLENQLAPLKESLNG